MATHKVMDHTGHSVIEFDKNNTVELSEAMARFTALTGNGHTAATRKAGDPDYTVTKTFDPTADETLFVPALQGG
jgi:hypothetical protein